MNEICQLYSRTPSTISTLAGRLTSIGTGHVTYAAFNWCFDNPLYISVVCKLGLIAGGAVMTLLSLLLSLATLLAYEKMRIDWVGAGLAGQLAGAPKKSALQRVMQWAQSQGRVPVFFVLSIFQDPFITTAWFRRGEFGSITRCHWRIFFASVVVSNLYWTLRSGAVGAIAINLWNQF